jgi:hypothetical protein
VKKPTLNFVVLPWKPLVLWKFSKTRNQRFF